MNKGNGLRFAGIQFTLICKFISVDRKTCERSVESGGSAVQGSAFLPLASSHGKPIGKTILNKPTRPDSSANP